MKASIATPARTPGAGDRPSPWTALAVPPVHDEDGGTPLALYARSALAPLDSPATMNRLVDEIVWRTEELVLFGKRRLVPRLVAFHGNEGLEYTYSRTLHRAEPWTPVLEEVRRMTEAVTGRPFNSVLCNLYRDGQDSMGWHSDDEPELGPDPLIAAASFGATRNFSFRAKKRCAGDASLSHPLHSGSVLVMGGRCQRLLQHALPKSRAREAQSPRISLTFRYMRA